MIYTSHRYQKIRSDPRGEINHRVGASMDHLEHKISPDLVEKSNGRENDK